MAARRLLKMLCNMWSSQDYIWKSKNDRTKFNIIHPSMIIYRESYNGHQALASLDLTYRYMITWIGKTDINHA